MEGWQEERRLCEAQAAPVAGGGGGGGKLRTSSSASITSCIPGSSSAA